MSETVTTGPTGGLFSGNASRALELLGAGGPVAVILLALSVIALGVILAKLAQYWALGLHRPRQIRDALAAVTRRPWPHCAARGTRSPAC